MSRHKVWRIGSLLLVLLLCLPLITQATSFVDSKPLMGEAYGLEVGGQVILFTHVEGLITATEVKEEETENPDGTLASRKVPGKHLYQEVVLRRSLGVDMTLADWRRQVEKGQIEAARKNVILYLYDRRGQVLAKWELRRAWPSQHAVGLEKLNPLEAIGLTVEEIVRVQP